MTCMDMLTELAQDGGTALLKQECCLLGPILRKGPFLCLSVCGLPDCYLSCQVVSEEASKWQSLTLQSVKLLVVICLGTDVAMWAVNLLVESERAGESQRACE